ncbi:hypothetical protein ACFWAP_03790 [Streptomyces goshikiensis]|uniref:hypothetical protein n=1 Tax=Streptomyces goshikiensis TaxID=1942 RepID=UPI00364FAB8D
MDEAVADPRVPGVKYKKVKRFRLHETEIDGVRSTRRVGYDHWEPVPPREWDELILRGVTGVAIGFTAIAVAGGTASLGGLLTPLVPTAVAYFMGSVFAIAWLYCLAIEYLNRTTPDRARPAMFAGWFFLLLSMGAVFAYGHTLNQPWAGGFGAAVDLVAKAAWWLLLREYAVPLDPDVANWVEEQEQKLAGRALLAARVRCLNRRAAYQQAVGGREYEAASAILASAETTRQSLPEASAEPVRAPAAPQVPPAQVVIARVEPEVVPTQPAAPVVPPVVSPVVPHFVPPVPPVPPADEQTGGGAEEPQTPVPPVADITRPAIAAICREAIKTNPAVTDAELVAQVLAYGHEDKPSLADTVRRSAQRIDPARKATAATG